MKTCPGAQALGDLILSGPRRSAAGECSFAPISRFQATRSSHGNRLPMTSFPEAGVTSNATGQLPVGVSAAHTLLVVMTDFC